MSLSLPLSSSPLRELFDVRHLAEIADPANRAKLVSFPEAKASARRAMTDRAVRAVHTVVLRADGELWLVKFGPLGGWKKLWNFGKL